jgi:hypothetical protein
VGVEAERVEPGGGRGEVGVEAAAEAAA